MALVKNLGNPIVKEPEPAGTVIARKDPDNKGAGQFPPLKAPSITDAPESPRLRQPVKR